MENKDRSQYTSPEIHVIDIEAENIICTSPGGDIEPITEEDW